MSLILSSERNFKIIRNKSSILSPPFLNEFQTIQQNKAPFNTKLEKFFNYSQERNEVLGPGAYYHPKQRSFVKKSFKKNPYSPEEINKNELYNIALFKIVNKKRSLNLDAQKSLIIDKENKDQVYNINNITITTLNNNSSNYNKSTSLNESKKNYKFFPTTLTKNRISSIPSKEQYLGYDFDKDGIPIIIDPESKIKLNQNNEYNSNTKEKKINAVDWSKMSKREIKFENNNIYEYTTKENNSNINNNLTEELNELTTNTDISNLKLKRQTRNKSDNLTCKTYNTKEKIFISNPKIFESIKNITCIQTKNRNRNNFPEPKTFLYQKRKKSLEDFVYDNLFNSEPGPGYYQSESIFDKYKIKKYRNKNFNFGSNSKRYAYNLSSDNLSNLGPGSYFKGEYKRKINPDFFPFSRKELPLNIKKYEKDFDKENVGPGKYEIKSQFDKTQLYYSGPLEKRFFDNIKKINLGPGEYLPLYNWNKNNNEKEGNKFNKDKNENNENKGSKGRDSYIIKNENPEAGEYNPHIIKSIYYDMISKENKLSHIKVPFNSKLERFLKKSQSTSDSIGPGKYFPNDKNIGTNIYKKDKNNGLFIINGNRNSEIKDKFSKLKAENEKKLGPGSYNLHNTNEWHKKSFNINSFKN